MTPGSAPESTFSTACFRCGECCTRYQVLLDDPEAFLWQNILRPVKIDVASLVVEAELRLRTGPVRVAYKRDRPRNWWRPTAAGLHGDVA